MGTIKHQARLCIPPTLQGKGGSAWTDTRPRYKEDTETPIFSNVPCHHSPLGRQVGLMESLGWIWVTVLQPSVTNTAVQVTGCTRERPPGGILHF